MGHIRPAAGGGMVQALVDGDVGAVGVFICRAGYSAAIEVVRA